MSNIKFSISVKYFKKLLQPLFITINKTSVFPITEYFLITKVDDFISFYATDLETVSKVTMVAKNECPDFSICLNSFLIKDFIYNSVDDDIFFEGNEKEIVISSGGFSLSIVPEKSGQYPKEPVVEGVKATFKSFDLVSCIKAAIGFCSNDDLRPAMTGVYLHDDNGDLMIVATDAHKMYYKAICKTPAALTGIKAIIPYKSCRVFLSMFMNEDITITAPEKHEHLTYISFSSYGKQLICRVIDANFPSYKVVIPKNNFSFYLKRKQLVAFLKLSVRFVNKSTNQLNLKIESDAIVAKGGDDDFLHSFLYKLPVYNKSTDHIDYEFAINVKFLMVLINVSKGEEFVKINHSGKMMGAIIVDDTMLLMPLMLNY